MTVITRFVQAVSHGGPMRPTLQVVHSAETPLRAGYAKSIAENWFGRSAPTSAHFMVDPVELIRMLSDNVVAYAVGPRGNGFTLNWEQAGYARFTRAQWTTDDGMAQMRLLAAGVRERGDAWGIPHRWATDAQIKAAAKGVPGGICTHDDIRRVLGGTSHTDPMPNYPKDLLLGLVLGSEEDDMTPEQAKRLEHIERIVGDLAEAIAAPPDDNAANRRRDGLLNRLVMILENPRRADTSSASPSAVARALDAIKTKLGIS